MPDGMHLITLKTAIHLTGLSRRTLWRRIAVGVFSKTNKDEPLGRTQIPLETLAADTGMTLTTADMEVILRADEGDAQAQGEVGLMLLESGQPERALYWLELAAQAGDPEAMHWLGRCHVAGEGVEADETLGLSWITRAAARGHCISQRQMEALTL